jgi:hypothetical protein
MGLSFVSQQLTLHDTMSWRPRASKSLLLFFFCHFLFLDYGWVCDTFLSPLLSSASFYSIKRFYERDNSVVLLMAKRRNSYDWLADFLVDRWKGINSICYKQCMGFRDVALRTG